MSSIFGKPTQTTNQEHPSGTALSVPFQNSPNFAPPPQPPVSIFSTNPLPKSEYCGNLSNAPPIDATKTTNLFGRPFSFGQPNPPQGLRKHALDTADGFGLTGPSPPKKANNAVTTSNLFNQVEQLADLHKKVPVRFQAAIAKLIDLKLLLLRSDAKSWRGCEDEHALEELARSSKLQAKLGESGVQSQCIEPLIEDKIRSLLIINGLFDVLASL
ncbi:MAG: hypothetical protein Q9207_003624 [Kuettlingeria erythrocarpa]